MIKGSTEEARVLHGLLEPKEVKKSIHCRLEKSSIQRPCQSLSREVRSSEQGSCNGSIPLGSEPAE